MAEKKYNFDEVFERRNPTSASWDVRENEIPLSIADMNFKAAPVIIEAMQSCIDEGFFTYKKLTGEFFDTIVDWNKARHDIDIKKPHMIYANGVLPAIFSVIRTLTQEDDGIIMPTPIYYNFFKLAWKNNREIVASPMKYDKGKYTIDWDNLEELMAVETNKILLLSNPHNPISRNFTYDELEKILKLAIKHNVYVLSDEVHADLTHPGAKFVSVLHFDEELQKNAVVFNSVTKAFNLAGLKASYTVVENPELRTKVQNAYERDAITGVNHFVESAFLAAYSEKGAEWLDALNDYLAENRQYLITTLAKGLPDLVFGDANATYLEWINTSNYAQDSKHLVDYLRYSKGLILAEGESYGFEGRHFIRWNYAAPRPLLEEAVERFIDGVIKYQDLDIDYMDL